MIKPQPARALRSQGVHSPPNRMSVSVAVPRSLDRRPLHGVHARATVCVFSCRCQVARNTFRKAFKMSLPSFDPLIRGPSHCCHKEPEQAARPQLSLPQALRTVRAWLEPTAVCGGVEPGDRLKKGVSSQPESEPKRWKHTRWICEQRCCEQWITAIDVRKLSSS